MYDKAYEAMSPLLGIGDLIFGILTMLAFIGMMSVLFGWFEIFDTTIILIIISMLLLFVWNRSRQRPI